MDFKIVSELDLAVSLVRDQYSAVKDQLLKMRKGKVFVVSPDEGVSAQQLKVCLYSALHSDSRTKFLFRFCITSDDKVAIVWREKKHQGKKGTSGRWTQKLRKSS